MLKVALCNCPNSKHIIDEKLITFMGSTDAGHKLFMFETLDELISAGLNFDLCFLGKGLRKDMGTLLEHIESPSNIKPNSKNLSFITYIDDPISDTDCENMIAFIRRNQEHHSMTLAVEFLTDKGLRRIALSQILFFEFYDRKVKIKAQDNEFITNDTLRNVMSLVGSHGFHQPHKSFIVNLAHITSIKNYIITMSDGSGIPLSQKRSHEFRRVYKAFLESHNVQN